GGQRYTAPSIRFSDGDRELEAAGFQKIEAYDVLLANLDPTLQRAEPLADEAAALAWAPFTLTTQEVAELLHAGYAPVDRAGVEQRLAELVDAGAARRETRGDDAVWSLV